MKIVCRSTLRAGVVCASLALIVLVASAARRETLNANANGPRLAHMVFFTLNDHSKESRAKFVAGCEKYLTGHEGAQSFSVGVFADDVDEGAVSVKDFDVALHVVFQDKAAKEKYLVNPRHKAFVEEFRASFAKVRVFDSYLEPEKK